VVSAVMEKVRYNTPQCAIQPTPRDEHETDEVEKEVQHLSDHISIPGHLQRPSPSLFLPFCKEAFARVIPSIPTTGVPATSRESVLETSGLDRDRDRNPHPLTRPHKPMAVIHAQVIS
jgi:hypothetical protein